MRLQILIICLFAFVLFNGCDKEKTTNLFWQVTMCADPWWDGEISFGSDDYQESVTKYLFENDVEASFVRTLNDGEEAAENCRACSCKTANRIELSVADEDVDTALALGLKRE